MSRHNKLRKKQTYCSTPLPARIEKALTEGRSQQALELARNLYRQANTPQNRELLKRAALARAADLSTHGYTRDAAAVLTSIASLDETAEFQQRLAIELARSGELQQAQELCKKLVDPPAQAGVWAHIADEAVRQGPTARQHLPTNWQGEAELIWQAFVHAEKGEDELARDKLQGIGLQSPFLQWKLFLRGLIAYHGKDDARAIDNWQRLDPERWPFRLAAPLRFGCDSDFARAQPPAAQSVLQQQAQRLHDSTLIQQLRLLQQTMLDERKLPQAFRTAQQIVPLLHAAAAPLVPRLAACFYWAIIHHGMPEDMQRYRHVFGLPADDPELARLEALALEVRGDFALAHTHWQRFEKSIQQSSAWPAEQKDRVRALVWVRMGHNADNMPEFVDDEMMDFFGARPKRPKPLKPGAADCYERALKLVPDQLSTHQALIKHYLGKDNDKKAQEAARRLLQQFPRDAQTLEVLGDLLMKAEKHAEALELFEQALHANPLEQRMRRKLSVAHAYQARHLVEAGRFAEARSAYEASLAIDPRGERYSILCKWSACEFMAGQAEQAEELLGRAYADAAHRLPVVFSMLIETIRLKLSKLKTRFNKEFNALIAEPPVATAAAALAETSAQHRQAGVTYHGQQTHEKKIRSYLTKALRADFTEEELRRVCVALEALGFHRIQLDFIRLGQRRFSSDPYFFLAEAQFEVSPQGRYHGHWRAGESLQMARELTQALPRGDRQDELMRQIQECERALMELNPFGSFFQSVFDQMPFDPFAMDEDEFDEDEDEGFFR